MMNPSKDVVLADASLDRPKTFTDLGNFADFAGLLQNTSKKLDRFGLRVQWPEVITAA